MNQSFCVFTTGSDTSLLQASCKRVGVECREYKSEWTTYVDVKLKKGIDFLRTLDHDIVMWLDGNDTLLLQPKSTILDRYFDLSESTRDRPSPLVIIAAERCCWPDAALSEEFAQVQDGLPRFLNAGGFIGPRLMVMATMQAVLHLAKSGDDQRAWTEAHTHGNIVHTGIDHHRRIFSCVGDGETALYADTCALHWNGKSPGREDYWHGLIGI